MSYNIYCKPPESELLGQGDVLDAEKLRESLKGHQDYYAENQHFRYFMILTQTCDLARGGVDFVFLSAVRKLSDAFKYNQIETNKARDKQKNFVRDLFRHQYNKRGYFYLPCDTIYGILEDSVADLRVMFSLHKMHYSALLNSRLCAITDVYAAQLGHIAGHMFSRVAVPDNSIDIDAQAKATLKEQGDRYKKRLEELLTECQGKCAVPDCNENADRFRSLPISEQNNKIIYEDCVLCSCHAAQWDEDRTLPWN